MHKRAFFLLLILCYQHLALAGKPATPKRPHYIITRGNKQLKLTYLTKRQRIILQQVLYAYQHKGMPLEKKSSSELRKKLLMALLFLLLAGGLCYVGYNWKNPAKPPQSKLPQRPSTRAPLGHKMPQPAQKTIAATRPVPRTALLPIPTRQPVPAHAKPAAVPIADTRLVDSFSQAFQALNQSHNNFKSDEVPSLISSMITMAQQSTPLASTIQGLIQPQAIPSHYDHDQHSHDDNVLTNLFSTVAQQVSPHTGQAPPRTTTEQPRAPISVYIPPNSTTSVAALSARLEALRRR